MKINKSPFFIVICVVVLFSCTPSFHDQYYKKIQGAWRISDFEHFDHSEHKMIDLTWPERFSIIGFENHNHLFLIKRENREDVFVRATYEIFKENDTLMLRIAKSDDIRLEGVYDFYIDTIGERDAAYLLQVSLDSKKTFLSALKWKDK